MGRLIEASISLLVLDARCLYEMYLSEKVEVVLPQQEQEAMQVALAENFGKFEKLILGIDGRDADVTVPEDWDHIKMAIQGGGDADGFHKLNASIRRSLFKWIIRSAEELLHNVDPEGRTGARSQVARARILDLPAGRGGGQGCLDRWLLRWAAAAPRSAQRLQMAAFLRFASSLCACTSHCSLLVLKLARFRSPASSSARSPRCCMSTFCCSTPLTRTSTARQRTGRRRASEC
jgi:hypothetical protein